MAGGGGSVKDENTSENIARNTYGYRTPLLSDDWLAAYRKASGNLNASGYTGDQQRAVDNGLAALNTTHNGLTAANSSYDDIRAQYGQRAGDLDAISKQGAHLLGDANQESYVGDATAGAGADYMARYADPFLNDVVGRSVNDYNVNTDRTLNTMRAGRDAAGAFGDRAAIGDAVYQGDATRGLGSLVSGLYSQGFNTAAGLGMQDRNATLLADQGNQTTRQGVNSRNTSLLDSRDRFNVDSQYKNDGQKLAAIDQMTGVLKSQTDLTQTQLDGIFKGAQVDTDAAKALFQAGQISQDQLNQILQLSGAGNGYSYLENQNTDRNSNTLTAEAHFHAGV